MVSIVIHRQPRLGATLLAQTAALLIGAIVGFVTLGVPGIFVVGGACYFTTSWILLKVGWKRRPIDLRDYDLPDRKLKIAQKYVEPPVGLDGLEVALHAKLAKCDGRISENEIATLAYLMRDHSPEYLRRAIEVFDIAKGDNIDFYETLLLFKHDTNEDRVAQFRVAGQLFQTAWADGSITASEEKHLREACDVFGFEYSKIASTANTLFNPAEVAAAEKRAYSVIGCSATDSDETIKARYRVLQKALHNDAIQHKNLEPELLQLAEEKLKQVNDAYEWIKRKRLLG